MPENNLLAPPTEEELKATAYLDDPQFAPPTEEELQATAHLDEATDMGVDPAVAEAIAQDEANVTTARTGSAVKGAVVGTGIGAAIQGGANLIADKSANIASLLGPMRTDQLNKIKDNYSSFQTMDVPTATKESFLTPMAGIDATADANTKAAMDQLKDTKVTKKDFIGIGEKIAYDDTLPIPEEKIAAAVGEAKDLRSSEFIQRVGDTEELDKAAQIEDFANKEIDRIKKTNLGTLKPEDLDNLKANIIANVKNNPKSYGFEYKRNPVSMMQELQALKVKQALSADSALRSMSPDRASIDMPSLLGRTFIDKGESTMKGVERILSLYNSPNIDVIPGDKAWEQLRLISEKAYNEKGEITEATAKAFEKDFRQLIKDGNTAAGELMNAAHEGITKVGQGAKLGFYDIIPAKAYGSLDRLGFTEKNMKTLSDAMLFDMNKAGTEAPAKTIEYLKSVLSPEEFSRIELASIKDAVNKGRSAFSHSAVDTALTSGGHSGRALNALKNTLASPKTQVAVATLPNKLKGLKVFGKYAGPLAGFTLGGISAAQARERGDIGGIEASGLTLAEGLNPLPLDLVEGYVGAKKEYNQSQSIPRAAVAGVRASAQPVIELGKSAAETAGEVYEDFKANPTEAMGISNKKLLDLERSGAYNKLEIKQYKENVPEAERQGTLQSDYVTAPKAKESFDFSEPLKNQLKKSKFESVEDTELSGLSNTLASSNDAAAQEYARVLQQIVSAPDQAKEAQLFVLNQQPAFREIVRKYKGQA
jgi:hypothetical protein